MSKFNKPQIIDILFIKRLLPLAHETDLQIRMDGQDRWFEADFLKHLLPDYLELLKLQPPDHKFTLAFGAPCFCGSDNCAACEICFEENHD